MPLASATGSTSGIRDDARQAIVSALAGNKIRAAAALGITRTKLYTPISRSALSLSVQSWTLVQPRSAAVIIAGRSSYFLE